MSETRSQPATLNELAQGSFERHGPRPCLGAKPDKNSIYLYQNYAEVAERVKNVAGGLLERGLSKGDRAAILSENRPEWAIGDLGCQMAGVISVPLFATLPAVQIKGILQDSGASLIFLSTEAQLRKIVEIEDDLPELRQIVMMNALPESPGAKNLMLFRELEKKGEAHWKSRPDQYEPTWRSAEPDDLATIIYTSGTTGVPKGVMLTHRNFIANIEADLEAIIDTLDLSHEDLFLSFLPLAHIYERTAGYYLPLRIGAPIAYCESVFTVDRNLREARPSVMMCVPRLYEAMRDKLHAAADDLPQSKREKYLDALALAQKKGSVRGGIKGAPWLGIVEIFKYWLYDMVVYRKIRDRFGGRLRAFVSGGAPMPPELGALFLGIGIDILEGYGLTETSPVVAANRPGRIRLGTVGEPVPGVEVKIAGDGEILVRGDTVMKGYWNKPDETAAVIDDQGWFHTGDVGVLEEGYLRITDRKKDILVLANGKNVAPAPIEMRLAQSRYINQAVLLGDRQKSVSALIVPSMDAVREYAAGQNVNGDADEQLLKAPAINKLFRREIDALTPELADFEKVRQFQFVPEGFSIERGELTPTLKVKRRVVAERYGHLIGAEK